MLLFLGGGGVSLGESEWATGRPEVECCSGSIDARDCIVRVGLEVIRDSPRAMEKPAVFHNLLFPSLLICGSSCLYLGQKQQWLCPLTREIKRDQKKCHLFLAQIGEIVVEGRCKVHYKSWSKRFQPLLQSVRKYWSQYIRWKVYQGALNLNCGFLLDLYASLKLKVKTGDILWFSFSSTNIMKRQKNTNPRLI